jgi:hypothetical protein
VQEQHVPQLSSPRLVRLSGSKLGKITLPEYKSPQTVRLLLINATSTTVMPMLASRQLTVEVTLALHPSKLQLVKSNGPL